MQEDLKGCIEYLILPAVAVALPKIAMVVKYLRNSVLSEMKKDYVRTAYSKGNSVNQVLYGHVLRNALIPVITFVAMVVAEILAGSLVIEQVFSIPGMGRLMITSILSGCSGSGIIYYIHCCDHQFPCGYFIPAGRPESTDSVGE